jgi:hypothetical protein
VNVQHATTGDNSPIVDSPITIGTVTFRIPEAKQPKIINILSQYPATIGVTPVQGGDSDFAHDWHDVLKAANWETDGIGSFVPVGSNMMDGILINIPGDVPADGKVWVAPNTPLLRSGMR